MTAMKDLIYIFLALVGFWINLTAQDSLATHKKANLSSIHSYIDDVVQREMEEYNVPGSVVVVVQDSSDVFLNAYGYADVENAIPVDKENTGFRIASVTKTFTATAILQLVEKGKLDVHQPIGRYLPDDKFTFLKDQPFTIHQLLTHTAGIDLTDIGDAARIPQNIVDLEEFVRNHIPDVVNTPGMVHSYSNFGYTILGYLIQEVSGMQYEDYIQNNILDRLNMSHSSMSQPLEEPFSSRLAKSYKWDGRMIHLPRDYTNTLPGGGLIASGSDMTNYLLMHLNGGTWNDQEILSPGFHRMLTSQQYGSKNTEYGVCYSFFENGWTGRRSIDHTGGQLGFLSLFLLIPETGTGVFIAHNSRENSSGFRYTVTETILDTLLNDKERHYDLPKPDEALASIASNYVGRYQQMNYPHSSFEKLGQLFGFYNSAYVVSYENDGMLTLNGSKFVMVDEELFHRNDSSNPWNVQFDLDEEGKATRIVAGTISYSRTPWFESKKVWQRLLAFSLLIVLVNLIKDPLVNGVKRIRKIPVEKKKASLTMWVKWTGFLLLFGLIGILVNLMIHGGQLADYGVPLSFKIPLIMTTAGSIMAVLSPFSIFPKWKERRSLPNKIWSLINVLSLLILAIGYYKFNIVGFHF